MGIWEVLPSFRSSSSTPSASVHNVEPSQSSSPKASPTSFLGSKSSSSPSNNISPAASSSSTWSILPSATPAPGAEVSRLAKTDTWAALQKIRDYIPTDPVALSASTAVLAVAATFGGMRVYRRYVKRIRNSDYVTSGMLDKGITVKGVVTSVGDGDNFRLFHTPWFYRFPVKMRTIPSTAKALKNETLHIRISGVDAPEAAHFGNPAQPHSAESLAWLRKQIMGKTMKCVLLRKDQYNRIVAVPYIHRRFLPDKPLPLMMLKEGMAVVYTSGGAEYGSWGLERMQAIEDEARKGKRGLWALKKFEHPAEYKKRIKAGNGDSAVGEAGAETIVGKSKGVWGLVRRMFGR